MKKQLLLLFFLTTSGFLFAQDKSVFSNHELSLDFGSIRNRYLYPITDIKYCSPLMKKVDLKFSARLRSYGTLYFYSNSAYDFTPVMEYYFSKNVKPLYFSAGVGVDTRIRLVHDERSAIANSAEPIISLALNGVYKKISFCVPLWSRFYNNGISLTVLPEISFRSGNSISIFIREECSLLSIYQSASTEWRQDFFIGTHILL